MSEINTVKSAGTLTLISGKKHRGYLITLTDDTQNRKYIHLQIRC